MKRITSSILALCLACGIAAPASASNFSINGYTMMRAQMSNNLEDFAAGADDWRHLDINQRIAVQFDWIASETLRAKLDVRVPQNGTWGNNNDFNTQNYFNLYEAYFSWIMPIGDIEFAAGQQYFVLPGYMGTGSNPVYDDHQTGIKLNKSFGDTLAVNFNFIRMENAGARTFGSSEVNALGRVKASKDVFTLDVPVNTSIVDVTPWGALALVEEGREINTEYTLDKTGIGVDALSVVGSENENKLAYFAGLTTNFKPTSNLKFGVDLLVSGSTMEDGEHTSAPGKEDDETYKQTTHTDFETAITDAINSGTFVSASIVTTETTYSSKLDEDGKVVITDTKVTSTSLTDKTGTTTFTKPGEDTKVTQADGKEHYTVKSVYTITTLEYPVQEYAVTYKEGFLADAHVSYDLPFMTIGLNGWYASGDKINLQKETIEYASIISLNGSWGNEKSAYFANSGLLHSSGVSTPAGTLGGGLTLISNPIQKLNVGFNAMYLMGTNEYINKEGKKESQGSVNFLTAKDSILDLGAAISYDIYDNFQVNAAGNYVMPTYDGIDTDNGFVLGLGVNYIF